MANIRLEEKNKELAFKNEEKKKRAAELVLANKELAFQNEEKEKRAAELIIANKELLFQNEEKGKRAAELVLANKELAFQNEEKEKRAAELAIANKELLFQNEEKDKRAAELVLANKELAFQNEEKGKRAAELSTVVQNLEHEEELLQAEVTERKRAEVVLLENEQRLSSIYNTVGDIIYYLAVEPDEQYRFISINPAFLSVTGLPKEAVIGKRVNEVIPEPSLSMVLEKYQQAIKEKVIMHWEEISIYPTGRLIGEVNVAPVFDVAGTCTHLVGSVHDITERKQVEMEIVQRLQNIQALQKIDQAIAGSLDLDLTLHVVLEQTKIELNIDAAAILLFNPHAQILEYAAGIGFRSKAIERLHLRLGEGHAGRAALERRTVSVTNLPENITQFVYATLLVDEGFATYFGTPLIAKGQVIGVLEVYHRSPFTPDENWLEFLKILAGQTAVAVYSANLFTELITSNAHLFAAYENTIEGWSHALDLRDKETEGHTQRVTEMTVKLALAAGITQEELVHVRRGALLHDIGKMGVPDHILLKPDKLTDEEWVAMRKHPGFAYELLSPIEYLKPALDIPYCHHEKWDGGGYPRELKGEQIPLVARLFSIVDVWDALLSDRPYRKGWPIEKVIEHIKSLSGTHFDPKAVELFLKVINEDDM